MRGTRLPATVPKQKNAADTAKRGDLKDPHRNPRYTANVAVGVSDPVGTLYPPLLAYRAFAVLIPVPGVAEYLHFEPLTPRPGLHPKVVGVYLYHPPTKQTTGPCRQ